MSKSYANKCIDIERMWRVVLGFDMLAERKMVEKILSLSRYKGTNWFYDSASKKILSAVEEQFKINAPSNSIPVMAGAYCEELGGNVVVKYNLPEDERLFFDYNQLDPFIKDNIEYLNMIRDDARIGGTLYEKLYIGVTKGKILAADRAGLHAEVLALNDVLKKLRQAGYTINAETLSKIKILVKGLEKWGNMPRCPHCYILTNGVTMIGNM